MAVRLRQKFGSGSFDRAFLVPIVFCIAFFAVANAGIFYFVHIAADRANRQAREQAEHLMKTALNAVSMELEGRLADFVWWEEMVDQYRGGLDQQWATANIGRYVTEGFGYTASFVLNPEHQTVFAYSTDWSVGPDFRTSFGNLSDRFLHAVQDIGTQSTASVAANFDIGGQIYLVAAAPLFVEEQEDLQPHHPVRPMLVFVRALDDHLMNDIAASYLLPDARLVSPGGDPQGVGLRDISGKVLARAVWTQSRPGHVMMWDMVPKILMVAVLLLLTALGMFLLWSRAASAAAAAKAQFLAKMSHELRTPLNPIIGFSEMMSEEILGPLPQAYRQYARDIGASGRHMQQVVEDLLDLSKLESGSFSLREEVVDLEKLLTEIAQISTLSLGRGGGKGPATTLKQEIEPGIPHVAADPLRVRQVVINLLSNAAKFSRGGNIILRAMLDDGAMRIEVADDGSGIPPEDLKRVFEPTVQLYNAAGGKSGGGAGLGLTISRELMKLHGGTLELHSELGKGTTAVLKFPRSRTRAV